MAFAFDELFVYGGQIVASAKKIFPKGLGRGTKKICHSVYIQGNTQMGKPDAFSDANATLMVGREETKREDGSIVATDRSLHVKGNTIMEGDSGTPNALNISGDTKQVGNTDQTGKITASGNITTNAKFIGDITQTSGTPPGCKAFDIPHPSKEGYRLRHICVEGPESAVYYRGRTNKNIIPLPLYWKDLIDPASLTVTLTPIGAHQNIIVKRWDAENIYLQNQGAMPINCFFHVFAQRIDIERLIPEYEGQSSDDYPGDNSIYSINK